MFEVREQMEIYQIIPPNLGMYRRTFNYCNTLDYYSMALMLRVLSDYLLPPESILTHPLQAYLVHLHRKLKEVI